jgi:hypothetical protein
MARRRMWGHWSRGPVAVQGRLAFAVRAERRERAFKRSILALTALALVGLVAGTPLGRYEAKVLMLRGRGLLNRMVGLPRDRRVDDERLRAERLRNAASARQALAEVAAPGSAMDAFLRTAGMDASSAVVRWGNVDRSIVLSSAVFEPDDDRAYRLKPGVRSVWLIGLSFQKSLGMFLIPDTAAARDSAARAGGQVVPESVQTTNSWGCRGPEPDLSAPVRILVLGDSMMQGALVGDSETPPARLQSHLASALAAPVSVLNTGHIGYSPEQYEQTLRAFGDRFRPHYVVISISGNDFGNTDDPANWAEGEYWIDRIADLCSNRGWEFLLVPAADEFSMLGPRNLDRFQGQLSRILKRGGANYVDPLESFTDALLRLKNDRLRRGEPTFDPLYNLHLMGDRHFSPLGSDLWARVVARRLLLVWDDHVLSGRRGPEAVVRHAHSAHPSIPGDESTGGHATAARPNRGTFDPKLIIHTHRSRPPAVVESTARSTPGRAASQQTAAAAKNP